MATLGNKQKSFRKAAANWFLDESLVQLLGGYILSRCPPWVFHTFSKASNNFNRYISVGSDGAPEEIHVCFGACLPCGQLPACNSAAWHISLGQALVSVKSFPWNKGALTSPSPVGPIKTLINGWCATFGLLTGKQFNCPAGFALKPSTLNHAGESQVGEQGWSMMGRGFFKWFLPDMAWIY